MLFAYTVRGLFVHTASMGKSGGMPQANMRVVVGGCGLSTSSGVSSVLLFGQRAHFDSLAAVERSPHLAQLLAHRFPGLAVHPVCASRLDTLLKGPLDTISVVSSLPFRSLPQGDRKQIEQAILRLSRHSRTFRFIQYSYLGRLPFPLDSTHPLQWTRRRTVLGNLPPATVWVLAPHHR